MSALLQIMGLLQLEDANGLPRAGAKAYTYQTGTTTPLTTYSDSGLVTPHANPVVADSEGIWPPVYVPTTTDVKVTFKTSADVTLRTVDPVPVTAAVAALSVDTAQLVNNSATNAKLADMATSTIKGRSTAGTGDPEDLTVAQVLALLKSPTLISTLIASASASLDFTLTDSTKYAAYLCVFEAIFPATDGVSLQFRVSTNGGSSYLSDANYHEARIAGGGTTVVAAGGSTTSTSVTLAAVMSIGSASSAFRGDAIVVVGGATTLATAIDCKGNYGLQTTGERLKVSAGGGHATANQVNAFQFRMSSGNIASGTIRVYGIAK